MISWPYIAGFFDGEGHASLGRLALYQSGDEGCQLLREIQSFWHSQGIRAGLYAREGSKWGKKTEWSLHVCQCRSIIPVLQQMLPFLRIKRVVAQDLLRYAKMFPGRARGSYQVNSRVAQLI